ncbi:hypothetical protein F5Y17DRAFT_377305 [Xylariaceae sp. FL0594]|nr:hypothetical protein F5Y17DRAFT_377305 [Xylariaceae sp. FL0594]
MTRLSPSPTNLYRSQSVPSIAASDTTYHSFYDVELFEPASPGTTQPTAAAAVRAPSPLAAVQDTEEGPDPRQMGRKDSGYESASAATFTTSRMGTPTTPKDVASTTATKPRSGKAAMRAQQSRPQKRRPALHRAVKSTPVPRGQSMNLVSISPYREPLSTYFHFPAPEVIMSTAAGEAEAIVDQQQEEQQAPLQELYHHHPPPPQTTHYWMSDQTRRLEYAAIDAATSGVKGWVMRHVVPDCFVPKCHRRLGFDDDSGSVRRYRLNLNIDEDDEIECDDLKGGDDKGAREGESGGKRRRKFGWLFGR